MLQELDFKRLGEAFSEWASQYTELPKDVWLHLDGKAIKGTVSDHDVDKQRFVNLVSLYGKGQGLVDNSKESEIPVVQNLIGSLGLQGATFTIDALHCQKKPQK